MTKLRALVLPVWEDWAAVLAVQYGGTVLEGMSMSVPKASVTLSVLVRNYYFSNLVQETWPRPTALEAGLSILEESLMLASSVHSQLHPSWLLQHLAWNELPMIPQSCIPI
jgi:hypothetical protein